MAFARPPYGQSKQPQPGEGEEYVLRAPTAEPLYDPDADAKIVAWRLTSFEDLGFDALYASTLALRRDVDREQVERMIQAGATPDQVREIVL